MRNIKFLSYGLNHGLVTHQNASDFIGIAESF